MLKVKDNIYLNLVLIIAILINFVSGINFDLYTPSIPAIAHYYHVSAALVKNTVTVTVIGFAIGCIVFGSLLDIYGRKRIILLGMILYTLASLLTMACSNIEELLLIRFIQGIMIASASVGSRVLIVDTFTGHRFVIGLLYLSIAYSLGPIIAPFIGGILQYHFGWQANFLAYALCGFFLVIMFVLCINENLLHSQTFSLWKVLANYSFVLRNYNFILCVAILGLAQFELMLYPTIGVFIVENILHKTSITYGNTAVLAGCSYLLGSLVNRLLIKRYSTRRLIYTGFLLLILGSITQINFAVLANLNLFTLLLPIIIMGVGMGFVFPNIFGNCLRLFPDNIGIATAASICCGMCITALSMFIISYIDVASLIRLATIFLITIIIQLIVFYFVLVRGKIF